MGIEIKFDGLFFVVLCVVLVVKCEEHHHIEQRTLGNKPSLETTLPSIPNNPPHTNDTRKPAPLESDPSAKLEQEIELLAATSSTFKTTNLDERNTSSTVKSSFSKTEKIVETNETISKFNVSSLLRANSSVSPVLNSTYIGATNVSVAGIQAPEVFPNGTTLNGTQILEGDKDKLQNLISHQNSTKVESQNETSILAKNETGVDTEVPDLLNKTNRQEVPSHQLPLEPHEPLQIPDKFNDDTEEIENGENTEDQLRKHKQFVDLDESVSQQKYLAAIIVSSLVLVSVLSYAALLTWRRYLENRYGSRTMLVNEEDFDDPNDMRHFSI